MKTTLLDLRQDKSASPMTIDPVISFNSFIKFLEKKITTENTIKKGFYEDVLQKFKEYVIPDGSFVAAEAAGYKELFGLVYSTLTPALSDEDHSLWALSLPTQPVIFYATDALYRLMIDDNTGCLRCNLVNASNKDSMIKEKVNFVYSLIFNTFYNFNPFPSKEEMVQAIPDKATGLTKYYRINVDSSFIEIFAKGPLPELTPSSLYNKNNDTIDTEMLYEKLPLSLFQLEGFSVLTLTNVTTYYAVEILKDILIDQTVTESDQCMNNVIHSLKTLVENNNIDFGLMPVLKVNNKLVFNSAAYTNSFLANQSASRIKGQVYLTLIEEYLSDPKYYFIRSVSLVMNEKKKEHIAVLTEQRIEAYALLPIYYNNKIAGLLEVYSKEKNSISENILEKLKTALPLLAQLMQNEIDEFKNDINNVIRDKFTAMQAAVQWKFNEVA